MHLDDRTKGPQHAFGVVPALFRFFHGGDA
jgi:hypothetical protein